MNYETWRATFQSSEQAARAAFKECQASRSQLRSHIAEKPVEGRVHFLLSLALFTVSFSGGAYFATGDLTRGIAHIVFGLLLGTVLSCSKRSDSKGKRHDRD